MGAIIVEQIKTPHSQGTDENEGESTISHVGMMVVTLVTLIHRKLRQEAPRAAWPCYI